MTSFAAFIQQIATRRGWPLFWHALLVVGIAWIPAQAIWFLATLFSAHGRNHEIFSDPRMAIGGALLLAPLLETYAMRGVFWLGRKWTQSENKLLAALTVVAVLTHTAYAGWGLHAAWAFYILGLCYLAWEKQSRPRALVLTAALHAVFNGLGYLADLALR